MEKLLALLFVLLACTHPSFSQDMAKLQRKPYTLKMWIDKETFYEEALKASSYVYPDNSVQLYPGETVYLEAELEQDSISRLTAVPEIRDSSNTIIVTFMQQTDGNVHRMMLLKIVNPFRNNLSYHAFIYLMKHSKWVKTSTIPVMAGLAAYETWPDIITSIALGGWRIDIER